MGNSFAYNHDRWLHAPLREIERYGDYWDAIAEWITSLEDNSSAELSWESYCEAFGDEDGNIAPDAEPFGQWVMDNRPEDAERDFLRFDELCVGADEAAYELYLERKRGL